MLKIPSNRSLNIRAAFLAMLLAVGGCGDKSSGPRPGEKIVDETAAVSVELMSVPGVCTLNDGVRVRLAGEAGPNLCYELLRIDIEIEDRTFTLRPLASHIVRYAYSCPLELSLYDTTLVLQPPEIGPYWIRVIAHNDTLVDSTKVK